MNRSDSRIYRYVVRHDGGTAPRPFDGICSLAICKPRIRRSARPGDWVVGFRSGRPGEVLYVMQVDETLPLGEYWLDARFANRRPGASDYPDNIYQYASDGTLHQVPNDIHTQKNAATDIGGRNVLLARKFWYFGRDSVWMPDCLWHLVHKGIGHTVDKNRRTDDVEQLVRWLAARKPGLHGQPVDVAESTTKAVGPDTTLSPVNDRRRVSHRASRCG